MNAASALVEETLDAIAAFSRKTAQDSQAAEERTSKLMKGMATMQEAIGMIHVRGYVGDGSGNPKPSADRGPVIKAMTCPYITEQDNWN